VSSVADGVGPDPLSALGLGPDATVDDVRAARRRLALRHHPDHGGDAGVMQAINEAADAALLAIGAATSPGVSTADTEPTPRNGERRRSRDDSSTSRVSHDVPSFTVEALPVETFEAMLVVASWLGETLDDDPPYRLDTYLADPFDCWCRLEVVPDAGASTVSLFVAGIDGAPAPDLLAVRDAWIAGLNTVDWP
jgi:hypothetical protein